MSTTFAVDRKDLRSTRWLERAAAALNPGQVRVRIDRFALTSNNITYAAFGESMHYWDFFPSGDSGLGCIPIWGFATVSESRHEGVLGGARLYGYFPMADEVDLEPATVSGLAMCLAERRGQLGRPATVGLTSAKNVAFTRRLGCYDKVVAYDDLATATVDEPVAYVDMSGDVALRESVHRRWEGSLVYSCSVGATHWEVLGSAKGLPGPKPVLFFAPSQGQKRVGEWGADAFRDRVAASWSRFIARVDDPTRPCLRVLSGQGHDAVQSAYSSLLDGQVPPDAGWILRV